MSCPSIVTLPAADGASETCIQCGEEEINHPRTHHAEVQALTSIKIDGGIVRGETTVYLVW